MQKASNRIRGILGCLETRPKFRLVFSIGFTLICSSFFLSLWLCKCMVFKSIFPVLSSFADGRLASCSKRLFFHECLNEARHRRHFWAFGLSLKKAMIPSIWKQFKHRHCKYVLFLYYVFTFFDIIVIIMSYLLLFLNLFVISNNIILNNYCFLLLKIYVYYFFL